MRTALTKSSWRFEAWHLIFFYHIQKRLLTMVFDKKAWSKEYRKKNRQKLREYEGIYRKKNRQKLREYDRIFYKRTAVYLGMTDCPFCNKRTSIRKNIFLNLKTGVISETFYCEHSRYPYHCVNYGSSNSGRICADIRL